MGKALFLRPTVYYVLGTVLGALHATAQDFEQPSVTKVVLPLLCT